MAAHEREWVASRRGSSLAIAPPRNTLLPSSLSSTTDAEEAVDTNPSQPEDPSHTSIWSNRYRGAVIEDLDPPPALSVTPTSTISTALMQAYERDYTHLTVISPKTRALLGYLSIPRLKALLSSKKVSEADPVKNAMQKFVRKKGMYQVITMETPLEELEGFFDGKLNMGVEQDFAIVTDGGRRFVMGVVTRSDLDEFLRRRAG